MSSMDEFIRPVIREELDAWGRMELPHLPGGFLTAVLKNDLAEACGRADYQNAVMLWQIVSYIWNELPAACWGSPQPVDAWLERAKALREEAADE